MAVLIKQYSLRLSIVLYLEPLTENIFREPRPLVSRYKSLGWIRCVSPKNAGHQPLLQGKPQLITTVL